MADAAFARYEGAWLRSQANWHDDPERFTVDKPTDPSHGDRSTAPPPLMMDAPVFQAGGEVYTDSLWENFDFLPPATEIDTTPIQGQGTPEESGHGHGGLFRPGASEAELASYRGQDHGAGRRETRSNTVYQFFNEVFYGVFSKGWEPPPITVDAGSPVFIRGINGHPANNGPGSRPTAWNTDEDTAIVGYGAWRRGDYEASVIQRDFTPPDRRHGEIKVVENDIITIIGDAPPPDKSDVYASPFSSLQKFLPKRRTIGALRRDPGPWDEDIIAQQPEAGTIPIGSADGMTVL